MLEKVTESKGTQIDRLKEGVDTLHTSVDLTLKASLDICNKIIDLEDTYKQVIILFITYLYLFTNF